MALASCSGGHDLMSNKPFRVDCVEDGKEGVNAILIHPDLPQATVLSPGSKVMPEVTYELAVRSLVRFELQRTYPSGWKHAISINRETGQISYGEVDGANGVRDVNPAAESTKCPLETL